MGPSAYQGSETGQVIEDRRVWEWKPIRVKCAVSSMLNKVGTLPPSSLASRGGFHETTQSPVPPQAGAKRMGCAGIGAGACECFPGTRCRLWERGPAWQHLKPSKSGIGILAGRSWKGPKMESRVAYPERKGRWDPRDRAPEILGNLRRT